MTTTFLNGFGEEGYTEETPLQVTLVHRHYRGDVPRGWEPCDYYYVSIPGYGLIDITEAQYSAIKLCTDPELAADNLAEA